MLQSMAGKGVIRIGMLNDRMLSFWCWSPISSSITSNSTAVDITDDEEEEDDDGDVVAAMWWIGSCCEDIFFFVGVF